MTLTDLLTLINQSESIEKFAEDNLLKIAISGDGRYILNYAEQILNTPKSWISHFCRALTISGTPHNYVMASKSFDRFYNVGENPEYLGNHDDIDYSQPFEVHFKLDGSVISNYNYQGKAVVQTRGSFATSDVTSIEPGLSWQKLFDQADKTDKAKEIIANPGLTYIYELCSPYNQVVEYYDTNFAKILAAIKLDGTEIRGCFEGQSYDCKNFEQVQELLTTLKPTQEGFVIAQWDENRQVYRGKKLKTKTWTELSHIKESGLSSISKLWNCVFGGDKDEVSSVFPFLKVKLDEMWDLYQSIIKEVEAEYSKIKDIPDQKEFAMTIKDSPYKGIYFSLRSNKTTLIEGVQKHIHSSDKLN
jgi:RNA ligase